MSWSPAPVGRRPTGHLVRRELGERGLTSVAVELPGDDPDKGLPEYVDLIVAAADGLDDVVVVAQSIGGFSGSWAADRLPTSRIVLLNAMIPLPGETAGEWWGATGSAEARRGHDIREGRDPDANFDLDAYFLHDVPAGVLASLGDEEHGESDAVFEHAVGSRRVARHPHDRAGRTG